MSRSRSLEQWAERAQFDQPIEWGRVEHRIIQRRVPFIEGDSRPVEITYSVAGFALIFFVIVPFVCAPLLGLAAVLVAREAGTDSAETWIDVATAALLVSALIGGAFIIGWLQDRGGAFWEMIMALVIAGCAATSWWILRDDPSTAGADAAVRYAIAGLGTGAIGFLLVATSRPKIEWPFDKRDRNVPKYKYMYPRYEQARTTVLAVLERRGLVHLDAQQREALERAPLGTWHTFDREQTENKDRGKRRR